MEVDSGAQSGNALSPPGPRWPGLPLNLVPHRNRRNAPSLFRIPMGPRQGGPSRFQRGSRPAFQDDLGGVPEGLGRAVVLAGFLLFPQEFGNLSGPDVAPR